MKHPRLLFLGLLGSAALVMVGLGFLRMGPLSRLAGPELITLDQVDSSKGYVEVEGMLHYTIRIQERLRAGAIHFTDLEVIVAPLMPPGDTRSREIRVLVLTPVIPEAIIDFDERSIRGKVLKPGPTLVTDPIIKAWEMIGYTFAPDYVILKEDLPEDYDPEAMKVKVRAYRGLKTPKEAGPL